MKETVVAEGMTTAADAATILGNASHGRLATADHFTSTSQMAESRTQEHHEQYAEVERRKGSTSKRGETTA
jgi:hypothetical protein